MKNFLINRLYIFLIIFFIITSCKDNSQKNSFNGTVIPTSTYYHPSKILDSITKVFLDSAKCKDCLNELYIDKVYSDETYFTFIARLYDKKYFIENNPLFFFSVNSKEVFIYTGVENFIIGNQKKIESYKFSKDSMKVHYLRMQFRLESDSISLVQAPSYPFFPPIIPAPNVDKTIPPFDPKKDYSK